MVGFAQAGRGPTATIIDRTGTLLAREPQAAGMVGMRIGASNPLMPGLNVRLECTGSGPGLDGVDRVFAFTQLPQTGAKVAVGLARSEVIGAQERAQDWLTRRQQRNER